MTTLNLEYRFRPGDAESMPPVVVMVHGWLGDETVMWAFQHTLPAGAAAFSPRGPEEANGGYGWWPGLGDAEGLRLGLAALREFILRLPEVHRIDRGRITLVGFSQGAAVCGALLLSDPGLVRGAALLAGFLPETAEAWARPALLAGKEVFIAHGTADETVPVAAARRARATFEAAGASVTYGEYPVGHKLNPQGLRDLKAFLKRVVR